MPSDESQNILGQAQAYQQQMQSMLLQKESLKMQSAEIKKALEDLEKSGSAEVYRISGPILIKTTAEDARKDLMEKDESIDLRISTIDKGEKRMRQKIEELKERLESTEKKAAAG